MNCSLTKDNKLIRIQLPVLVFVSISFLCLRFCFKLFDWKKSIVRKRKQYSRTVIQNIWKWILKEPHTLSRFKFLTASSLLNTLFKWKSCLLTAYSILKFFEKFFKKPQFWHAAMHCNNRLSKYLSFPCHFKKMFLSFSF